MTGATIPTTRASPVPEWQLMGSALLLGLSGAGHCLGMCGGIASALSLGGAGGSGVTVSYHLGRVTSYTLLGGALGLAVGAVDIAQWTIALRYLAGCLLVAMGLYMADWWRGMMALERLGARLWRPVQQLTGRWLPVRHWPQAFAVGLTWGFMPCGLIYSALAWSATAAQGAIQSGTLMLLFGLGTLPAMLGASLGAGSLRRYLATKSFRTIVALCLIAAGAWALYTTATHSDHLLQRGEPGHHQGMHH